MQFQLSYLIVPVVFAGFAYLGDRMRRDPVSWTKILTLGIGDGNETARRFVGFCGWFYLIIGSIGAVFLSIRLIYDFAAHGIEF